MQGQAMLRDFFKSPSATKPPAKAAESPATSPLFSPAAANETLPVKSAAGDVPKKVSFETEPVSTKSSAQANDFFKTSSAKAAVNRPAKAADFFKPSPAKNAAQPSPGDTIVPKKPSLEAEPAPAKNAAQAKAFFKPSPAKTAAQAKDFFKPSPEVEPAPAKTAAQPKLAASETETPPAVREPASDTAASGAGELRDSASLQAELESIHAKYAAPGFLEAIEGFGMTLDNELRKAGGKVTDSLLGLLAQGSRLPATDLAEHVLENLQQLAQSPLVISAELPASSREILDRLPGVAEYTPYGNAKAEDLEAQLMIWEMKPSAVSKLGKPYKEKVQQELKRSRDEKKADKKRLALLRSMLKVRSKKNYLDKPKNLEKFLQDCDKLQELANATRAAADRAGSGGSALGSLASSGSNSTEPVPLTAEQTQRAAELRKIQEAEELKQAALAKERKQKKAEEAALAKAARQKEKEEKAQAERQEKERLRKLKVEADKLEKQQREAEKAVEQAERLKRRAEAKLEQEREAAEEKQRKLVEKERKAAEKRRKEEEKEAVKVRKQEEREAEKRRKQEEKEAAKTRKVEEEAQRVENERKKQKKAQSAWANFGFIKKKETGIAKSSASSPASRPNGPRKKLWKWDSSQAWKLAIRNKKISAEFATATAQVPWNFSTLGSETLHAILKTMRERQAGLVKTKRRQAGRRPIKFLDFRGCPFQKKHGPGHPQEGQDVRPPWYGPMDSKKTSSSIVTGRTPLKMEKEDVIDYDLDSEDEYEGDAEDIENSDGEEDKDEGDDEEGGFVVPDGTFSDDEGVEGDGDRLVGISTTSSAKEVVVMTGSSLPKATVNISMHITIRGPNIFSPYDCDETGQNLLQKQEKAKKLKEKEEDRQRRQEERSKKQVQDSMLLDLVRLVHGTTKGKDKIQEEFLEKFPHVGKSQFTAKLNEVAKKEKRVDLEGVAAKHRWWIRAEVLSTVGLTEDDLPVVDLVQPSPTGIKLKRRRQDAATGANKAQNTQFWQKMGVKTTQSVCDEANATWSELEGALERFVRPVSTETQPSAAAASPSPVAAPHATSTLAPDATPGTCAGQESPQSSPKAAGAAPAPSAEQGLVELWDILTTTSKGEVREASSGTIQKMLVEVANTELASSTRAFLADLLAATFANPNLNCAVESLVAEGLPCKLLKSIQPMNTKVMATSVDAQMLISRVLRLLMYFFKRHCSVETDAKMRDVVDSARLDMLGAQARFVLDCVACPADADPRKQVRGAASGLLHQLLLAPALKLCAVPLKPQHLLVKTAGECFETCVKAIGSAAGLAAAKFQILVLSRLLVLGDGSNFVPLLSLRSIEQPIAVVLELVNKDYNVLEAMPCALALVEQLLKSGEASETLVKAVSHLFDVALGRPANAASASSAPHASARQWLQQCCKLAGNHAAAQQLAMPCPQNELRGKAVAALRQTSPPPDADGGNAAAEAVLKALALKLAQ